MSDNDPRNEDLPGDTAAQSTPAENPSGQDGAPQAAPTGKDETGSPDDKAAGASDGDADGEADGGPPPVEPGRPGRQRRVPWTRRQKVLRGTAIGLAVLLVAGGAGAAGLYYDLMGDIDQKSAKGQLGDDRPAKLNKSLNILLLGSDSRDGENSAYAGSFTSGARSDTAILLHLSPNRDQAVGISFPRDSMVQIPSCKKEKGGTVAAQFGMLNAAFAYAGPTCTWKTLETLTGIHIDHFVQIDFAGFKRMVDALDGVEICVDRPVNDPRADLTLRAGKQTVKGDQALGYVRARYSLGDGGDLGRIERQQKFMASVVDKATSSEVLTDPAKTYKFLKAVTRSVTTDDELDLPAMRKLAEGLRGMSAGQVKFVTVPVKEYAPDHNRVQWDMKLAQPMFDAVRHDNELPAKPVRKTPAAGQAVAPAKVRVTVVDAGGSNVGEVVKQLRKRGFDVRKVEKGAAAADSQITYASAAEAQASALARVLPNALLVQDAKAPAEGVRLIVGKRRNNLTPDPAAINKIRGIKAGQNLCK